MKAHLIDAHLLVPSSRSSAKVKVKYQGHGSQKMGFSGALAFHKHILFFVMGDRARYRTKHILNYGYFTCLVYSTVTQDLSLTSHPKDF